MRHDNEHLKELVVSHLVYVCCCLICSYTP